jgi:hypothetical protein
MNQGIWNVPFNKSLEDGTAGKQAHKGIFYVDGRGRIRRLTEAEGHEIAYNPETEETNPIGYESPSSLVKGYNESFGKDIIIKKGAPDYEFFRKWLEMRPTGDNAMLRVFMVDFMVDEKDTPHYKYKAYSYMAACTVESGNYTDGRLTVNFTQDGDRTVGIMKRTDSQPDDGDPELFVYEFDSDIDVTNLELSDSEVELKVGEEKWVETSFSPLGCSPDFTVESGDKNVCVVERRRQSVIIKGRGAGTAEVTVTSTDNIAKSATIDVIVS